MKKNNQKGRKALTLFLVMAMLLSNFAAAPFTVLAGGTYILSVKESPGGTVRIVEDSGEVDDYGNTVYNDAGTSGKYDAGDVVLIRAEPSDDSFVLTAWNATAGSPPGFHPDEHIYRYTMYNDNVTLTANFEVLPPGNRIILTSEGDITAGTSTAITIKVIDEDGEPLPEEQATGTTINLAAYYSFGDGEEREFEGEFRDTNGDNDNEITLKGDESKDKFFYYDKNATADNELFDNRNDGPLLFDPVLGPPADTEFSLSDRQEIYYISTYHKEGADQGRIRLEREDGRVYGPWYAEISDWKNNKKWEVWPDTTVKAGPYRVVAEEYDSAANKWIPSKTWLYNSGSNNGGFARVASAYSYEVTIVAWADGLQEYRLPVTVRPAGPDKMRYSVDRKVGTTGTLFSFDIQLYDKFGNLIENLDEETVEVTLNSDPDTGSFYDNAGNESSSNEFEMESRGKETVYFRGKNPNSYSVSATATALPPSEPATDLTFQPDDIDLEILQLPETVTIEQEDDGWVAGRRKKVTVKLWDDEDAAEPYTVPAGIEEVDFYNFGYVEGLPLVLSSYPEGKFYEDLTGGNEIDNVIIPAGVSEAEIFFAPATSSGVTRLNVTYEGDRFDEYDAALGVFSEGEAKIVWLIDETLSSSTPGKFKLIDELASFRVGADLNFVFYQDDTLLAVDDVLDNDLNNDLDFIIIETDRKEAVADNLEEIKDKANDEGINVFGIGDGFGVGSPLRELVDETDGYTGARGTDFAAYMASEKTEGLTVTGSSVITVDSADRVQAVLEMAEEPDDELMERAGEYLEKDSDGDFIIEDVHGNQFKVDLIFTAGERTGVKVTLIDQGGNPTTEAFDLEVALKAWNYYVSPTNLLPSPSETGKFYDEDGNIIDGTTIPAGEESSIVYYEDSRSTECDAGYQLVLEVIPAHCESKRQRAVVLPAVPTSLDITVWNVEDDWDPAGGDNVYRNLLMPNNAYVPGIDPPGDSYNYFNLLSLRTVRDELLNGMLFPVTVSLVDEYGNPVKMTSDLTVDLSASGASGKYYRYSGPDYYTRNAKGWHDAALSDGWLEPVNQVVIPEGEFYTEIYVAVRGDHEDAVNLEADAEGLDQGSTEVTVIEEDRLAIHFAQDYNEEILYDYDDSPELERGARETGKWSVVEDNRAVPGERKEFHVVLTDRQGHPAQAPEEITVELEGGFFYLIKEDYKKVTEAVIPKGYHGVKVYVEADNTERIMNISATTDAYTAAEAELMVSETSYWYRILKRGWNVLSTPVELKYNTLGEIIEDAEESIEIAYFFDSEKQEWRQACLNDKELRATDVAFVKMKGEAKAEFFPLEKIASGPHMRVLKEGWNLYGPAIPFDYKEAYIVDEIDKDDYAGEPGYVWCDNYKKYVLIIIKDGIHSGGLLDQMQGDYMHLISPGYKQPSWSVHSGQGCIDIDYRLYQTYGYWFKVNDDNSVLPGKSFNPNKGQWGYVSGPPDLGGQNPGYASPASSPVMLQSVETVSPPPIPAAFYGTVVNENPRPDAAGIVQAGTIEAVLDGEVVGFVNFEDGEFGMDTGNRFIVQCLEAPQSRITFRVNGFEAEESFRWFQTSGNINEVTLTIDAAPATVIDEEGNEAETDAEGRYIVEGGKVEIGPDAGLRALPEGKNIFVKWLNEAGEIISTEAYLKGYTGKIRPVFFRKVIVIDKDGNTVQEDADGLYVFDRGKVEIGPEGEVIALPGSRYIFEEWLNEKEVHLGFEPILEDYIGKIRPLFGQKVVVINVDGRAVEKDAEGLYEYTLKGGRVEIGPKGEAKAYPDGRYIFGEWVNENGNFISFDVLLERYTGKVRPVFRQKLTVIDENGEPVKRDAIGQYVYSLANGKVEIGPGGEVEAIPDGRYYLVEWLDEDGVRISSDELVEDYTGMIMPVFRQKVTVIDASGNAVEEDVPGQYVYSFANGRVEIDPEGEVIAIPDGRYYFVEWLDEDGEFISSSATLEGYKGKIRPVFQQKAPGVPGVSYWYRNLEEGWNLLSTPVNLKNNTLAEIIEDAGTNVEIAYVFNAERQEWQYAGLNDTKLGATDALFVKMKNEARAVFRPVEVAAGLYNREFKKGWNLYGPSISFDKRDDVYPFTTGVRVGEILKNMQGEYVHIISPGYNQPSWSMHRDLRSSEDNEIIRGCGGLEEYFRVVHGDKRFYQSYGYWFYLEYDGCVLPGKSFNPNEGQGGLIQGPPGAGSSAAALHSAGNYSPPSLPAAFYGTVVNTHPEASGLDQEGTIEAILDGEVVGTIDFKDGEFGMNDEGRFIVQSLEGSDGQIAFRVNGFEASESFRWGGVSGAIKEITLTVNIPPFKIVDEKGNDAQRDNEGRFVVDGGRVETGKDATLKAIPDEGHVFVQWVDENGELLGDDYTLKGYTGNISPVFYMKGNVTGSGQLSVSDAIAVLRHIVGLEPLTGNLKKVADMDGEGDVTVIDAILILRIIVGLHSPV